MNYSDMYLLRLIKRLSERLALLEMRLGDVIGDVTNITSANSTMILRDAPSSPEPAPDRPDLICFLTFKNGAPGLIWNPDTLNWI